MKKLILFILFCFIFYAYSLNKSYAQELTFVQKIERTYNNFLRNKEVLKNMTYIKSGWFLFKKWFNNLPGIRHYNNSIYSSKNYKKVMNDMGKEYKPHLHKDSDGTKLLIKGKHKWDNL